VVAAVLVALYEEHEKPPIALEWGPLFSTYLHSWCLCQFWIYRRKNVWIGHAWWTPQASVLLINSSPDCHHLVFVLFYGFWILLSIFFSWM
jgi:hypothetical protein